MLKQVTVTLKAFQRLLELAEDLRCYTRNWDYRYGEHWDKELKAAREVVEGDSCP